MEGPEAARSSSLIAMRPMELLQTLLFQCDGLVMKEGALPICKRSR